MKRILTTLAAILSAVTLFAQNDGHVLTDLWKKYDKAHKADLPQQEANLLKQIKEEAAAKHFPVDFYDAATEYVNTVLRRDWKQRNTLNEALQKEVEDFDEPVVSFLYMADWLSVSTDKLWDCYKKNEARFSGSHPALQRGVSGILNGSLKPFIRSDKEWALWYVAGRRYGNENEAIAALREEVKGVYPNEAILEYFVLGKTTWLDINRPKEVKAYEDLAKKYEGKAFSVYPRAQLLRLRFAQLKKDKAGSDAYKTLYADAQALEKERKSYKGDDKTLVNGCTYPANLIETLTEKDISIRFNGKQALVVLQNLTSANVTLRSEKKTVQTWKLKNTTASFFVTDTLKIKLPVLSDGEYTLEAKNGDLSAQDFYEQYTLSLAHRVDSRGRCVYVADYETGVPLKTVTLHLMKNGKEVTSASLKLDGFTPLPQEIAKLLAGKKSGYDLVAENGNRKSRSLYLGWYYDGKDYSDYTRCNIYKDRGAYNPGDTLQFKAVVFKGSSKKGFEAIKDRKVEIRLHDSEDNILETLNLTTNEWGSVSGKFVLPKGLRNGRFELEAVGLGYDWFRVDEFVLPSFDVHFDAQQKLTLAGDDATVSGSIESYSGHPLSGARLHMVVKRYDGVVWEDDVPIASDNSFSATFRTRSSGYHNVELTITEATGETHSFSDSFLVADDIGLRASVDGPADADLTATSDPDSWYWRQNSPKCVVNTLQVNARVKLVSMGDELSVPIQYTYKLLDASDKEIATGKARTGDILPLALPADGYYVLHAMAEVVRADGSKALGEVKLRIFCIRPNSRKLGKEVKRVFLPGPLTVASGGAVEARLGTAEGDAWAIATLYGEEHKVLVHKTFHVRDCGIEALSFDYKDEYPDAVRLQVFYFIHGQAVQFGREYRRAKDKFALPLEFTRFQDKAYPGVDYSFTVKTGAGTEVLAAAWDKSIDAIAANYWPMVTTRDFSVDEASVSSICGRVGASRIIAYGYRNGAVAKSVGSAVMAEEALAMPAMLNDSAEDSVPMQMVEEKPSFGDWGEVTVREKFSSALTFQPHLYPQADGTLEVKFRTSDKLSTYYVRVYAHDKQLHNAVAQKELVVSLPVKVALLEPRFLYVGDRYEAVVTVSSISDEEVSGLLALKVGDREQTVAVTVPARGTVSQVFPVEVTSEGNDVTLTAAFKGDGFSDAVRVNVPVYPAAQRLTEAHSAVLRAGMDREALLADLRSRFVNVPAAEAALKEITILDMVRDAIPEHVVPSGNDVLSLSEAWYVQLMASRLLPENDASSSDEELLDKILACRNADGGFGWFEGMSSSPVITAVLLERFALLRDRGFEVPDGLDAAVEFLDKCCFDDVRPVYCGYLSDAQYMHVRALYSEVPFEVKPVSDREKKRMKEFTKDAKSYLIPSKKDGRGMNGQILAKSRRLLTLRNLVEREGGLALAKAWGISLGAKSKLTASIKADVASLKEYAVEHRDGGWYYPNAVMPWRGLLESEAYAHALLCQLLSKDAANIADGIRLWLMLQKETQKWDAEPAFIDAITAILDGSEAVLQTRVVVLSATYDAPFKDIKATGNGFTIGRKFYRDGKEIRPGDTVKVGDRIQAVYSIWNAENRSFVKVTAPREASLTPVQQLSGYLGYGFIAPRVGGVVWRFRPQGYRNVKASATEYFFDTYPEENTTLSEEFFVERAGVFQAPVLEIESLYASHYRANEGWQGALESAR
ncbi:MAG: hypothetical protein IK008_01415 [Bacteroidales bacterium]|nr:hypothetical protein [Bacteroidales bacterium]